MKNLKSIALALILSLAVATPKSEAAIGCAAQDNAIIIVGAMMSLGGPSYLWDGIKNGEIGKAVIGFLGLFLVPPGLIVLDENAIGSAEFHPIDEQMQTQLELKNEEIASFNSEIEQLNAIAQDIGQQINDRARGLNQAEKIEISKALWEQNLSALAPQTQNALRIIFSEK